MGNKKRTAKRNTSYSSLLDKFMTYTVTDTSSNCWLWLGALFSDGYGGFYDGEKTWRAHRWVWAYHNGDIPKGLVIRHSCDVRHCVNPDHLLVGTHKDNMRDMVNKGRQATGQRTGSYTQPETRLHGDKNGMAKLTRNDIKEIRSRVAAGGITQRAIALEFGVCYEQVYRIVNRLSWKNV